MEGSDLIVVKYGSETVTDDDGIDSQSIVHYAEQLSRLPQDLIVVSSGAVKAGRARWRRSRGDEPVTNESLATLGTAPLWDQWMDAFKLQNDRLAGQMLATHREIKDPKEGARFQMTLKENIDSGIITVLNENDAVNDEEMVQYELGGDNDELAFVVARKMGASALLLLTTVPGLLDSDKQVVKRVEVSVLEYHKARTAAGQLNENKQGMPTKVAAAIEAAQTGIQTYIAEAGQPFEDIFSGEIGTHFVAKR